LLNQQLLRFVSLLSLATYLARILHHHFLDVAPEGSLFGPSQVAEGLLHPASPPSNVCKDNDQSRHRQFTLKWEILILLNPLIVKTMAILPKAKSQTTIHDPWRRPPLKHWGHIYKSFRQFLGVADKPLIWRAIFYLLSAA
jgi:hypothetical protein